MHHSKSPGSAYGSRCFLVLCVSVVLLAAWWCQAYMCGSKILGGGCNRPKSKLVCRETGFFGFFLLNCSKTSKKAYFIQKIPKNPCFWKIPPPLKKFFGPLEGVETPPPNPPHAHVWC